MRKSKDFFANSTSQLLDSINIHKEHIKDQMDKQKEKIVSFHKNLNINSKILKTQGKITLTEQKIESMIAQGKDPYKNQAKLTKLKQKLQILLYQKGMQDQGEQLKDDQDPESQNFKGKCRKNKGRGRVEFIDDQPEPQPKSRISNIFSVFQSQEEPARRINNRKTQEKCQKAQRLINEIESNQLTIDEVRRRYKQLMKMKTRFEQDAPNIQDLQTNQILQVTLVRINETLEKQQQQVKSVIDSIQPARFQPIPQKQQVWINQPSQRGEGILDQVKPPNYQQQPQGLQQQFQQLNLNSQNNSQSSLWNMGLVPKQQQRLIQQQQQIQVIQKEEPKKIEPKKDDTPTQQGSTSEENLCQICLDKKKSYIVVPCGHFIYCEICIQAVEEECLLCRGKVLSKVKVFN